MAGRVAVNAGAAKEDVRAANDFEPEAAAGAFTRGVGAGGVVGEDERRQDLALLTLVVVVDAAVVVDAPAANATSPTCLPVGTTSPPPSTFSRHGLFAAAAAVRIPCPLGCTGTHTNRAALHAMHGNLFRALVARVTHLRGTADAPSPPPAETHAPANVTATTNTALADPTATATAHAAAAAGG